MRQGLTVSEGAAAQPLLEMLSLRMQGHGRHAHPKPLGTDGAYPDPIRVEQREVGQGALSIRAAELQHTPESWRELGAGQELDLRDV